MHSLLSRARTPTAPSVIVERAAERQRLASLDLLRFGAAFAVVFYHYIDSAAADGTVAPLHAIAEHGYLGVNLFFIISGFVVLWSARDRSPRDFVRSRVVRLFPEFWLAVLVSAAVFFVFDQGLGRSIDLPILLGNLTMIPQYLGVDYIDGVYWTLGVEIKFYLLVWLVLLATGLRHVERWLLGWLALSTGVFLFGLGPARLLVVHPSGPLFIAGCLFYLVFESGWSRARMALLAGCLALAANQAVVDMPGWVDPSHISATTTATTVLVVASFFAIFAWIVSTKRTLKQVRVAAALGGLTYPLYLLHNTGKVIFLGDAAAIPPEIGIPAALVVSIALSLLVTSVAGRFIGPSLKRLLVIGLGPPSHVREPRSNTIHPRHASTHRAGVPPARPGPRPEGPATGDGFPPGRP